jgi:hypothetical protein
MTAAMTYDLGAGPNRDHGLALHRRDPNVYTNLCFTYQNPFDMIA